MFNYWNQPIDYDLRTIRDVAETDIKEQTFLCVIKRIQLIYATSRLADIICCFMILVAQIKWYVFQELFSDVDFNFKTTGSPVSRIKIALCPMGISNHGLDFN